MQLKQRKSWIIFWFKTNPKKTTYLAFQYHKVIKYANIASTMKNLKLHLAAAAHCPLCPDFSIMLLYYHPEFWEIEPIIQFKRLGFRGFIFLYNGILPTAFNFNIGINSSEIFHMILSRRIVQWLVTVQTSKWWTYFKSTRGRPNWTLYQGGKPTRRHNFFFYR